MSDEKPQEPEKPDPVAAAVLEDGVHSAEQTRATVKWLAGALGGIPTLALVGVFVRAPGDKGWNTDWLLAGLVLVVLGAAAVLWVVVNVLAPAEVSDASLQTFDVTRVPGANPPGGAATWTGQELIDEIASRQQTIAWQERRTTKAAVAVKAAEGPAKATEAIAKAQEAVAVSLKDTPAAFPAAQAAAVAARQAASASAVTLGQAEATLGMVQAAAEPDATALKRRRDTKEKVVLLATADQIHGRLRNSAVLTALGVTLLTLGVAALALAPIPKDAAADAEAPSPSAEATQATSQTLVRLSLTPEGKKALNCQAKAIDALLVDEENGAVSLVTLPSVECPDAVAVTFKIVSNTGIYGSYSPAEVVTPSPSPSPSPSPTPSPSASQ